LPEIIEKSRSFHIIEKGTQLPIYEIEGQCPQIGQGTWVAPSAEIIGDVEIGENCFED